MDLKRPSNYCENVGPTEISVYRFVGKALFYGLTYLLRPSRTGRTIRNYWKHRSDTVFEEPLFALIRRRRIEKEKGGVVTAERETATR